MCIIQCVFLTFYLNQPVGWGEICKKMFCTSLSLDIVHLSFTNHQCICLFSALKQYEFTYTLSLIGCPCVFLNPFTVDMYMRVHLFLFFYYCFLFMVFFDTRAVFRTSGFLMAVTYFSIQWTYQIQQNSGILLFTQIVMVIEFVTKIYT